MAALAQEMLVAEYSTTTGDGAITLGGRIGNYKTFAEMGVANTNVVFCEIRLVSGGVTTEFEMGFYTYASSGPTLTIVGTPLRSSNSNNKVSWSAGTKQVVISQPPYLYMNDDRLVVVDPADYTKRVRLDAGAVTAGQTRVLAMRDSDLNLATLFGAVRTQILTSSGTYTPHANMLYCLIECIGGGGGGGGVGSHGSAACGGGGGGAGSYSRKLDTKANIGTSQTATVGVGGSGGTAGFNAGGSGGATSLGSLCTANGGSGGTPGGTTFNPGVGGNGGAAGTGDFATAGASGHDGTAASIFTVSAHGGHGAPGPFGGGARGPVASPGSSLATNGIAAASSSRGAGGSGGVFMNVGGSDRTGGAGAAGIIIITEFCSE